MNFRDATGEKPEWCKTGDGFSNFEFIDQRYRSNPVLRRILSLARRFDYQSLLVETIPENGCAVMAEENEALALRCPDFKSSTVHRLSFFKSAAGTQPRAEDFIGYAVLKQDEFHDRVGDHIYEAVLPPFRRARQNNFVPRMRSYSVSTAAGPFQVKGVLYAQQNALTYVCAHVAIRSVLETMRPQDVSYAAINKFLGIDHVNNRIGTGAGQNGESVGMRLGDIENYLKSTGLHVPQPLIHEPASSHHFPDEYQRHLYGFIESATPALLCFELGEGYDPVKPKPATADTDRHLIPVLGHTFNEDAWMPDAQRKYFAQNFGYFPSENFLSTYVVHDDNVGPYYCIPRHYVRQAHFRALLVAQEVATPLLPLVAEALGLIYLNEIANQLPPLQQDWYGRFAVFTRTGFLVLRTQLMTKKAYLDHLRDLKGWDGTQLEPDLIGRFVDSLPTDFWMVEASAPELFASSRRKFGEVLIAADKPLPTPTDLSLLLGARLPGVVLFNEKGAWPMVTTTLQKHSQLFTRCE